MNKFTYYENKIPETKKIMDLYQSVGWSNYTVDIDKLIAGINNSSFVVCAYDGSLLVGLLRVISDNYTIAYVQDILVLPQYQNQGIGKKLVNLFLERFSDTRQKILLADDDQSLAYFYDATGFSDSSKLKLACYIYCGENEK